jgi:hypothetical protein
MMKIIRMHRIKFCLYTVIPILFILSNCRPGEPTATSSPTTPTSGTIAVPTLATITQTPGPTPYVEVLNPLTGVAVEDPSLLQLPATLLSISHFPATARPQAGLSFAPYVFEIYITEGATRFLTTFYGQTPAPEVPITGNCDVRTEIFTQTNLLLGNQVWNDANQNGVHEAWEKGIGGVCANLYDADHELLQQTTTDTNGYYGFNVEAGQYYIAYLKPDGMKFTKKDAWDDESDSDVDPATAWTDLLDVSSSVLSVDAGLIPFKVSTPTTDLPPAKVGPVRSGRLVYADIAAFFPQSCLIYAYASPEVLAELPQCGFVFHEIQGGGYMLDIDQMVQQTKDHYEAGKKFDYTSNIYSDEPPAGGVDASRLDVYYAWLHQSAWAYDPLYQSWWRYVDLADLKYPGVLHSEVDRLTNRQLHFENVIVLFAEHEVISPTNLSIHLEEDWIGNAFLFRDGRKYDIHWSTVATDEEVESGNRKPIQFFYPDNRTPFPLKPGHTWIKVVTPLTSVTEKSTDNWLLQFSQPPGAK